MLTDNFAAPLRLRPRRLAACLAVAFAVATLRSGDAVATAGATPSAPASHRPAATRHVTNCEDDGRSGSLRQVVDDAGDGDTIDLSRLTCSTITLETGAILIPVDDLTILGPGPALTISADYRSSVLVHTGSGTLSIYGVHLYRGEKYESSADNAIGGCVFSAGNVILDHAEVSHCAASWFGTDTGFYAKGGAIYAEGNVTMVDSLVSYAATFAGNARVPAPGGAIGGGIYALGKLTMLYSSLTYSESYVTSFTGLAVGGGAVAHGGLDAKYSTISHNNATLYQTYDESSVGGLWVAAGDALIEGSVISNNGATTVGGLEVSGNGATLTIENSTIANNYASHGFGGVTASGTVAISNSTIARNHVAGQQGGAGLVLDDGATLELESTIIADNMSSGAYAADLDAAGALTISGAADLVGVTGATVTVPAGTLRADPQLGPLQSNGGRTATLALLPGSPAIDAGNNLLALGNDQRGRAFPRVVGSAPDIGAFEANPDLIFANAFD
jgi:parallel beta helix pectate lyase-like protein